MTNNLDNMDAGAGSGAMGRFALLQGDSESPQQAYQDALALTGLPIDIDVVERNDLPFDVPMRYNLFEHCVEINTNLLLTRSEAAQTMAEELLHATDHTGNGYTLSAGSRRLSLQRGDIAREAIRHFQQDGYFAEFLSYPLSEKFEYEFTQDRIRAELLARLGVLYLANPNAVQKLLPLAYEVYHELFRLSAATPFSDEYVRGKVWRNSHGGFSQIRLQFRKIQSDGSSNAAGYRQQSTNQGLDTFRTSFAKLLDSPSNGRKARL